jgi:two-component system, cell cycle sensor histidine kinase and response regulator CckA
MKTVLIVDDHASNRYLLRILLTKDGYQVIEAADGAEALEQMNATCPDLIISDILMPVMDGYAFCRAVKSDKRFLSIPFIFCTATYTNAHDEALGRKVGADRFLVRPMESAAFLTILRELLADYETGRFVAQETSVDEETVYYRLYNEVLIHKLEEKMATLDQVNRSLTESEARYRRLTDNAQDLIYRIHISPELRLEYVSPSVTAITGFTPEEHYADPLLGFKLVHPEDRDLLNKAASGALASGTPFLLRWVRTDGEIIWTELRSMPVLDQAGTMIALEGIARDVTEQKRHEQSLAESERFARSTLDALSAHIAILDETGTILAVNQAWRNFAAENPPVTTNVCEGSNYLAVCDRGASAGSEDAVAFSQAIRTVLAGEQESLEREYACHSPSEKRWFIGRISRFPGPGIRRVVVAHENITARKQHERENETMVALNRALRNAAGETELLSLIIENLTAQLDTDQAAIGLIEPGGEQIRVAIGTGLWAGMVNRTFPTNSGLVKAVLEAGKTITFPVARHDPRVRFPELLAEHHSLACVPLIAAGKIMGILWIATDAPFSEYDIRILNGAGDIAANALYRTILFERTRTQAEQLSQVMQGVPEGIVLLDAENRVILANSHGEGYFHLLADTGVGKVVRALGGLPLATLLTSSPVGRDHTLTAGAQLFELMARPIEMGPLQAGWVLVLRDITEDRKVQKQMQLQERLAAIGQLAAGIAHDFNNIMSVISMYAQMTARSPGLTEREQHRMATINQQAERAAAMIHQILDFSRQSVLERAPLDLLPLLKEDVKLLERTLPESIELRLHYAAGDYTVLADATRLQQMVMNLAINARDAMEEGGTLTFDLHYLQIASLQEAPAPGMEKGGWIRLKVSDTGTGISPAVLEHIFEPFFTTKDPGKGTGLGLAQVHGIVGQHHGQITVESRLGEGTTFTVYLPALTVKPSESALATGAVRTPGGSGERLLVVEDDAALRSSLSDLLTLYNYQVTTAINGEAALTELRRPGAPFDLVISDVVMPRLGGIALFRTLRELKIQTPMILLTGHPMGEVIEGLYEQGLRGWLAKPPSSDSLLRLVAKALKA